MRILFFAMSWLLLICGSHAQINRTASLQIGFPNTINNSFFLDNPRVNYLKIHFEGKQLRTVSVYYSRDKEIEDEFYDLNFEGDKYFFDKKYGEVDLPNYPGLNLIYPQKTTSKFYKSSLNIDLSRDSLKYAIDVFAASEQESFIEGKGLAHYLKDDRELEENLKNKLTSLGNHSEITIDTALLFRGIVYPDGNLGDIQLIYGRSSGFTSIVIQELEKLNGSWQPAMQGGRRVKSFVDIFICFKEKGLFSVTTCAFNRR